MAERRAVYAGSFDPPTNGHHWVIERGAELFDELHVSVAVNPAKKNMFSVDERMEMLEDMSRPYPNVIIGQFVNRYTVHYARDLGCRYLLRGLRNAQDYDAEQMLCSLNRDIAPEIETVLLPGPDELLKVSSSNVKGLMGPENWEESAGRYVSDFVLQALINKFQREVSLPK
jgi:pantetheine-phosphate adenylyltransferase